jgi:poly-gamma-glutamate capsule biosynthesis protein CapA/YwtB (metallophosphatase superfamily)
MLSARMPDSRAARGAVAGGDDMEDHLVTVFLCGDVMTGRGVDQILPHPGDPRLSETGASDARTYVGLAEAVNGPIPNPVDFTWPWGEALHVLEDLAPDVRVMNLETSVTRNDDDAEGKMVHYRMAPENLPCLTVARPDACALANNHVLDFGYRGLEDTREALAGAGIRAVGAGRNLDEARRPAIVPVKGGRVTIFSVGAQSSGIPESWAAGQQRPGVDLLPDLSEATARQVAERIGTPKGPDDIVIASIHWGSNWGFQVPADHVDFAHRLVEGGVDIVHGHSSHHVRPVEVYRGKLILYGCGDFIDDYEGIGGYDDFRDDLRLLYFATVEPDTGSLTQLRLALMQARQMRLHHASNEDAEELRTVLDRISDCFGSRFDRAPDGMLGLRTER